MNRICVECSTELPLTEFYIKKKPDRYDTKCKPCRREANRQLKIKNADRYNKTRKVYAQQNPRSQAGRHAKRRASMTEEERREHDEYVRQRRLRRRVNVIEEYLREHGGPPLCACGCGSEVNFDTYGRPNQYTYGHRGQITYEKAVQARWGDRVPADKFRVVIRRLLDNRGWNLRDLSEKAEVEYDELRRVMYSNTRSVSKSWVTKMLRNLSQAPRVPTPEEQARMQQSLVTERQLEQLYIKK